MKTLGQIACEGSGGFWDLAGQSITQELWEAAAQAVRAAVIDECANELEEIAVQEPRQHIMMSQRHSTLCAATWVRDLKENKETT
jgi:hypothetical protein